MIRMAFNVKNNIYSPQDLKYIKGISENQTIIIFQFKYLVLYGDGKEQISTLNSFIVEGDKKTHLAK